MCAKRVVTSQIMFLPMVFFSHCAYTVAIFTAAIQVWQQIQFHPLSALACFDAPTKEKKMYNNFRAHILQTGINQYDSRCEIEIVSPVSASIQTILNFIISPSSR